MSNRFRPVFTFYTWPNSTVAYGLDTGSLAIARADALRVKQAYPNVAVHVQKRDVFSTDWVDMSWTEWNPNRGKEK